MRHLAFILLQVTLCAAGGEHAAGEFEWAGTFNILGQNRVTWTAQKGATNQYADPTMKILILQGNAAFSLADNAPGSSESVKKLGGEGFAEGNEPCPNIMHGGTIPISTNDPPACFTLVFDQSLDTSTFSIDATVGSDGTTTQTIPQVSSIAIFAQHFPTEFKRDLHYLRTLDGSDIKPINQHPTFEWAGTFDVSQHDNMTWTAQAGDEGKYADPTMKILILQGNAAFSLADNAPNSLQSVVTLGREGFAAAPCVTIQNGGTIPISTNDPATCFTLVFAENLHTSVFSIDPTVGSDGTTTQTIPKVGSIAVFAQHFPTEFERDTHYLKGVDGSDIEPIEELPEEEKLGKRWGAAIGAGFLVLAVTQLGVLFLVPGFVALREEYEGTVLIMSSAFAAGALIAAAFFLMLYESTHLVEITDSRTEAKASALWGSFIILGVLTPWLVDFIIASIVDCRGDEAKPGDKPEGDSKGKVAVADAEKATGDVKASHEPYESAVVEAGEQAEPVSGDEVAEGETASSKARMRVLSAVLLGDFMHNLVDGFILGAAFSNCDNSMAWTIAGATIAHELAQEIADFFVLTNPKQGNLSTWLALLLNLASGTSIFIGIVVAMSMDIPNLDMGLLLAFGGGVYVYVGLTECFPRINDHATTFLLRLGAFGFFALGAVAIGLVLLDHEHCVAGGGDGHAHAH